MNMKFTSVTTVIGDDQINHAIARLVLAFATDPVARWIYDDPHQFLLHMPRVFRALGTSSFQAGGAHRTADGLGIALWLPPGVHGVFDLEAAHAVAADPGTPIAEMLEALESLVLKSLVTITVDQRRPCYRLLETLRLYAFEKLSESGEFQNTARQHVLYYSHLFEKCDVEWETGLTAERLAHYYPCLGEVRVALDWAFSPDGDRPIGIALTCAAVPLWMHLSLLEECRVRVERAISSLETSSSLELRKEMKLRAAVAASFFFMVGPQDELRANWKRVFEIGQSLEC